MKIKNVYTIYFSATENTKKVAEYLGEKISSGLSLQNKTIDFTLPLARLNKYSFEKDDLVIIAVPTYGGKVPVTLREYIQSAFNGDNTLCVPVVTFGNRNFDNALVMLKSFMENNGFNTIAAGAIVCEHSFSIGMGAGRPGKEDFDLLDKLAFNVIEKVKCSSELTGEIVVPGDANGRDYIPRGLDGEPTPFRGSKPATDIAKCINCGLCAQSCPMGAIDPDDVSLVTGVCMMCHRCVKICPVNAKYFDNPNMIRHKELLKRDYIKPATSKIFI